jgi:hypothetical protein
MAEIIIIEDECCVCERFFYDDEDIVVNSHGNKMCRKCDEECEWEVNCENCKKVCGKEECPFDSGYGGEPFICDECVEECVNCDRCYEKIPFETEIMVRTKRNTFFYCVGCMTEENK